MTDAEPQLQPPGAGLPRAELFFSRLGFRLATPFLSRQRASRWVRSEADRMLARVRTLAPADAARRVLVPRLSGLEDSSRYWSALMTLEHFVIVNTAVAGIIEALAAGRALPVVVSTADVKPSATADASMVARFEAATNDYLARVGALPDLRSKVTHRHPWFGELTALGWHRLSPLHHRIHRRQIERIIRGLKREPVRV